MLRGWRQGLSWRPLPDLAAVVLLAAAGAVIGWYGRFWSFFYDEWGTIFYRRSGGFSAFFAPHNGHLQAVVIAIYRLWFAVVGLRSYHLYQATVIAADVALGVLFYLFARRRLPRWAAVVVPLPVVALGAAWQVVFWGINVGFVLPLIALVAILLWRHPAVLSVALLLALASSALGVAVAAGALLVALSRADRRRQLVAWAIPVAAYVVWWFAYRPHALPPASLRHLPGADPRGDVGTIAFSWHDLRRTPSYVVHSAKAAADALTATGHTGGWWTLAVLLVVVATMLVVRRRVTWTWVALVVTVLTFWTTVGLTRSSFGSPEAQGASRYLYPGSALLALILIETFRDLPWPRVAVTALVVAVAGVMAQDVHLIRVYGAAARDAFARQAAALRVAQCRPDLPPDTLLDPAQAPGVTAGAYRRAVAALGSPPDQQCHLPR